MGRIGPYERLGMELGKTLIDAACRKTGMSRYALSKSLHVSDGFVSRVYNGRDPVPPALATRLAVMAGVDARRAALEALVSQEKDHDRAVELARALGVPEPIAPPPPEGLLQPFS